MVHLASTVFPPNISLFPMLSLEESRLIIAGEYPMSISPYFSAPLRQRINEDMTICKLATKIQIVYIRGVNKLCEHFNIRLKQPQFRVVEPF
jgi:hypothetical protein